MNAYLMRIIEGHFHALGIVEKCGTPHNENAKKPQASQSENKNREGVSAAHSSTEKESSLTHARVKEMFDEFWAAFPGVRKINKKKTAEKFAAIIKAAEDPEEFFRTLMIALNEKWKRSYLWESDGGKFVCAPIVWLDQERWNDEPEYAIRIPDRSKPINWMPTDPSKIEDVF